MLEDWLECVRLHNNIIIASELIESSSLGVLLYTRTPKNFHEWKKDQVGMDVLRITETNLNWWESYTDVITKVILTYTYILMYSYTIHVYVLHSPCLLSNQTLIFISRLNFARTGYNNY